MRPTLLLTFTLCTLTTTASAQHDPQRNATQAIATANLEKAEAALAKADADDPETLFVQTMLRLKQNDTAAAKTALRRTGKSAGYDLLEFESSKLTNRHTHGVVKTDGLIWGYNKTCSFGLMRFNTATDIPQVTFECVTIDGTVLYRHELKASELKKQ